MISKRHPAPELGGDGSKIAIVFNGSPLFTGDAGSGESNIRRWIIENDWLDAIIALPDQMFYNTGIYTYIWLVTNKKKPHRQGTVQLIDGTRHYRKMKKSLGNKRNELSDEHIAELVRLYADYGQDASCEVNVDGRTEPRVCSKIFNNQDFGYLKVTVERPLRLNFQLSAERIAQVQAQSAFTNLAVSKKRKNAATVVKEQAEGKALQQDIIKMLEGMAANPDIADAPYRDRATFSKLLEKAIKSAGLKLTAQIKKAILAGLSERDPEAEICRDATGSPEPDADLRDTEIVPLPKGIALPLPLKHDNETGHDELLKLVKDHCQAYLAREVLPHVPDAWIDHGKTKVGYEIPLNRHFYVYQPPRPLAEIEADIKTLEQDIVAMLGKVLD
jgi:type I restriction enzyme M protein